MSYQSSPNITKLKVNWQLQINVCINGSEGSLIPG